MHDAGVVTCDLGSVAPGAFARVSILVRANEAGTATNTASATAAESDPVPGNNTAVKETSIVDP